MLLRHCGAAYCTSSASAAQACSRALTRSVHPSTATPYTCSLGLEGTISSNSSSSSRCSSSSSRWSTSSQGAHRLSAKASRAARSADDDDDSEDSIFQQGKPLRVERLLANLGYGKRKECTVMIKRKQLVYAETGQPAKVNWEVRLLFLLVSSDRAQ
jgi:hypothetical protein